MWAAFSGMVIGIAIGSVGGALGLGFIGGAFALMAGIGVGGSLFLAISAGMAGALLGGVYGALYGTLHGALFGSLRRRFSGPKVSGSRLDRRIVFIHLVCLGTVIVLAAYLWSNQAANLPDSSEVQSMTGTIDHYNGRQVSFTIRPEHFAKVLSAFVPATRDWAPSKWVGWGQLTITCKDGRTLTVDLYETRGKIGAFSVHPGGRPRNSSLVSGYFRGGTDQGIQDAIINAHESSKVD